ncbi:MAG TPA: ABC transporter permease [Kofleriaceae bacterium]|nr:ABC transporter permease [Kofleriaceae bacterium]
MRVIDAVLIALENLAEHKLRTALTMLGMMFGVGAVIAMLSIGAGAEKEAMAVIERLGVHNVVIQAKEMRKEDLLEIRKKSLGVSERDARAIAEAVPGVEMVAPELEIKPYKVLSAHGKTEAEVFGVSHRQAELSALAVSAGRFIDARDELERAQVCVIGAQVRRDLFGAGRAIGSDLKINDMWCEVIGVLSAQPAQSGSVGNVEVSPIKDDIYLPFTTAEAKLERDLLKSPLSQIVVRLGDDVPAAATGKVIGSLLDRLHGGASDYEIIVPEALLAQSESTQRLFNLVMGCIAGISLLVGGIGIMNIMLASVLEQTREIGIRRAVGARRRDIRFQFLVTSFSLSLIGGLIGVGIGLGIAGVVAAYASWPTVVTTWSIALSLSVSVAVGLVSGMYPAVRAARLDPIEALRRD